MVDSFFSHFSHWTWWIVGLVLVAIEVFAWSTFFLWMGLAALITGGVLFVYPDLSWKYQMLLFAVLSVGSVFAWRRYYVSHPPKTDAPTLNRRGEQYVGRILTLESGIESGRGAARLEDTRWSVVGPELPAGTRIRVVGVEGASLRVEPASE